VRGAFHLWGKKDDYHANTFPLGDFLRCGAATPQKINFLARPIGVFEIAAPGMKYTSWSSDSGIQNN
jgi:hypothetical protein